MTSKSFLVLAIVLLTGCATVEQQKLSVVTTQLPITISAGDLTHIVIEGETLWRISRMYQIDLENIIRANRISDSTIISPGQTIIIPKSSPKIIQPQTNFATKEETDFIWPSKGVVITQFKQKINGVTSKGIDIFADTQQDVIASCSGKIIFMGNIIGYGNTLIIEHANALLTIYSGNASFNVNLGDQVRQGAIVAKIGGLPRLKNCSLHFEIRKNHKPMNPMYFLSELPPTLSVA